MKYIDAERLRKEVKRLEKAVHKAALGCADRETRKFHEGKDAAYQVVGILILSLQQDQPEVDLEKFTEKMDAWKSRYNHPDNIPIKAAMAFTARMFYQYPNVARQWYESLPKATMDNARKEE